MTGTCVCCSGFTSLDRFKRCKTCGPAEEFLLVEVRGYIRQHGQASIHAICEEFGVNEIRVKRWIAEERLGYHSPKFTCESCGGEVVEGFTCPCQTPKLTGEYHGPPRALTKRLDEYWDKYTRIRKHQRRSLLIARR